MKYLIDETFKDLDLTDYPYDKFHTALGEYHHIKEDLKYGNFYDPIPLYQYRSLGGSWMVGSDINGTRYIEQNRGDKGEGAYKNVYSVLVNKQLIYSTYTLETKIRLFDFNNLAGLAFNYITSRNYYAVGLNGSFIEIYKRLDEEFITIEKKELILDDLKTYDLKISVTFTDIYVYIDNNLLLKAKIKFIPKTKVALLSKALCRYYFLRVYMSDFEYKEHIALEKEELKRIETKRSLYPRLELIKKIDLKNFGSGRQLRIKVIDNKPIFILAQHQKRYIRDSFARISALTTFDIDGNVLWTKGESNNSIDNTLISCDLPFQIADLNNDSKFEVIFSMDFKIYIIDLLTGKSINEFDTPIIKDDPLFNYDNPFNRLNVDMIRLADFSGLGYKSDIVIKDRYNNVFAYDKDFNLLFRYNHKNTGHFPFIYDFNNDKKDEMFVGYDMVSSSGEIIFSLPMNSDHTDEIIYARLKENEEKKLILASGNEGLNIINLDGTIYKHNEIGHAQRISVAKYNPKLEGLQIMATSFWGSDGIISLFDSNGDKITEMEMESSGSVITPINYDGKHILALTHSDIDGGLIDYELDKVVLFPNDNHPLISSEVFDIDNDGIDEIITWDLNNMFIYKASKFEKNLEYEKYDETAFSNYRGEYLLPKED